MDLKYWRYELRLTDTWRIASNLDSGGKTAHPVVFVELTAPDGLQGYGESAPSHRYLETVDTVVEFLHRVDATRLSFQDIPASLEYLDALAPGHHAARAALDVALWDGAARAVAKPVHDLLGLGFSEGRHRTAFSIGISSPPRIREKVLNAAAFPILKLKLGSERDHENLAALRSAAPDKPLMVDANEAWQTKEAALNNLEWLADDGRILLVEQPMPATAATADLAWLKARTPLPLFADESCRFESDIVACAAGFHGVNVKLVKCGGIYWAMKMLQAAQRAGLKTMLGCMIESSLLISAAAHLAELADYLDLDGNLLIANDPFEGVTAEQGQLSFARCAQPKGLRVRMRSGSCSK
ncbi:MAG: dipeptide epimerase [Verrucomicrobiota bacterium]